MLQEILTYLIVASAFLYAGYSFYVIVMPSKKKKQTSCSGGCAGCSMKSAHEKNKLVSVKQMNFSKK